MPTERKQLSLNEQELSRLENLVANAWYSREQFFTRFMDPRRNIDDDCGYPGPDELLANYYRDLYDRNPIAERVVQLFPKESWQVTPRVYESAKSKIETPFEKDLDQLGRSLFNSNGSKSWHEDEVGCLLWTYLLKADILSGIGVYGIILLGLNDGLLLEQPAYGAPPDGQRKDITGISQDQSKDIYGGKLPQDFENPFPQKIGTDAQYFRTQFTPPETTKRSGKPELMFLRAFDESLVQVVQYEASLASPRFGQPVMYQVTLNDPRQPHSGVGLPLATVRVHWSRVIHIADNGDLTSEIFAKPRMKPVLNNILDLRKLYGGSAEGYWRGAFPGLSLETVPQLGGDVDVDQNAIRDMMHKYTSKLDRFLVLVGMSAKSLAPQVVDPTPQIEKQIEAICIELGCPVRVFKGSERGELASTQDDSAWNDRLKHRQQFYITPKIIVPFIDRLIKLGILSEPTGYKVEWPDLDSSTDKDKAGVMLQKTQAYAAYVACNVETLIPPHEFMTKVDNFDEDTASAILTEAVEEKEAKEQEDQDLADEHGMIPKPPEGFQHAPQPPQPPTPKIPGVPTPAPKILAPATPKPVSENRRHLEQELQFFRDSQRVQRGRHRSR